MNWIMKIADWLVKNIWENETLVDWLSAIGTVGAVWLSLWLATKKEKNEHLKIEFLKNDKKDLEDKLWCIGRVKLYNPTKENKTLYDLRLLRGFKGFLVTTDSEFSIIEKEKAEKINYVSLTPKKMVIIEYEIATNSEKCDKMIFEGKEEDGYVMRCSYLFKNSK